MMLQHHIPSMQILYDSIFWASEPAHLHTMLTFLYASYGCYPYDCCIHLLLFLLECCASELSDQSSKATCDSPASYIVDLLPNGHFVCCSSDSHDRSIPLHNFQQPAYERVGAHTVGGRSPSAALANLATHHPCHCQNQNCSSSGARRRSRPMAALLSAHARG